MVSFAQGHKGRIRELDGWRGVGVLLVVFHHALLYAFPLAGGASSKLEHVFAYAGDFGVRIFFVISGFVITRLLILEERQIGSISLRGFYARRFFRIVPVYYLFLLAVGVLSLLAWTPVSQRGEFVAAFFLYDVKRVFHLQDWFLGHTWSLAVEEQFYILFPLFWLLCPARKRAAVLFGTLAIFLTGSVLLNWGLGGSVFSMATIVGFCCINVGALLAIFERRALEFAGRLPSWTVFLLFLLLLVHPVPGSGRGEGLYSVCVPFGVGLVVMHSVARQGWLSSSLKLPAIQWCGLISYSAYLWQELFTGPASAYGSAAAGRAFHLMLPLLPLLAALSFYWIERPCTRFGRKLALRLRVRETVEVVQEAAAT